MEDEVKVLWYLGLEQVDGRTLFYNEHNRNWSIWRRDATGWAFERVAVEHLATNKQRNSVPQNTKVIKVTTIVEEETV